MRSLTIAGVVRPWNEIERNTLKIDRALTYQVDSCSFRIAGAQPIEGSEVIIEDNGERLFAGIIVKSELSKTSQDKMLKVYQVDCDDYTILLDRKLVVEVYENMSASDIFLDIVAKYCPDFTVGGVQPNAPVIESTGTDFNYIHPSECFRWLCDYTGWHWQPDYFKDLQFFNTESLALPAPISLQIGGQFRFGKHSFDRQGLRNRIYVRGGTMLSDPQPVEWKADGVATIWGIPFKPHDISFDNVLGKIGVSGTAYSIGIENFSEDTATKDFLLNFQEKYIKKNLASTPAEGATISFMAKQDIQVITIVDDLASQAAIAAIEGGDGIYEHVIVNDKLMTLEAAEAAGEADLREYANPKVKGNFSTQVTGWMPGQIISINLPDRGIVGTYLIQRVTIEPSSPTYWTYSVEYGGRLIGIPDLLKALVSSQQKKQLNDTEILQRVISVTESIGVSDELVITERALPYLVEESAEYWVKEGGETFTHTETDTADFDGTHSDTEAVSDKVQLTAGPSGGYTSDLCTGGTAISGGDYNASLTKDKAYDDNESTPWCSQQVGTNISGVAYIGYDFGVTKHIRRVRIKKPGTDFSVSSIKVQRSSNGADWSDVQIIAPAAATGWETFDISASGVSRYWRLLANANLTGTNYWAVYEIEMMEEGVAYNASGTYTTLEIDPSAVGVANAATLTYEKTTPANTTLTVDYRIYNGSAWGDWQFDVASGVTIIAQGTTLTGYKVQARFNLATTDTAVTPSLNSLTVEVTPSIQIEFDSVGTNLNIWQPGSLPWAQPQYRTSEDGTIWGDWQDVSPLPRVYEVFFPGRVQVKSSSPVEIYNWKKPWEETDAVCGMVVVSN
jgi:hypothetical protein